MSDSRFMMVLLAALSLMLVLTLLVLLAILIRVQLNSTLLLKRQLWKQQVENQKLRNQLRAPDLPTLNSLNYLTLPPQQNPASTSDALESLDLTGMDDDIAYEENLAANGYKLGDVPYDLAAAGWESPVTRRDGATDPSRSA